MCNIFTETQPKRPKVPKDHFCSTNAYILVYTRLGEQEDKMSSVPGPPSQLMERVASENEILTKEIDSLVSDEVTQERQEEIKRQEMAQIFVNLPVTPGTM